MLALLLVLTALVPLIIVLAPRQFGGQSSAGKAGGGGGIPLSGMDLDGVVAGAPLL